MAENPAVNRIKRSQLEKVRVFLMGAQANCCAICRRPFKGSVVACVDHDHTTGHIRGALCRACNRFEGQVKNRVFMAGQRENPIEFLNNLAKYWEYYSTPRTKYLHPDHVTEEEKREARNKKARVKRAAVKAATAKAGSTK